MVALFTFSLVVVSPIWCLGDVIQKVASSTYPGMRDNDMDGGCFVRFYIIEFTVSLCRGVPHYYGMSTQALSLLLLTPCFSFVFGSICYQERTLYRCRTGTLESQMILILERLSKMIFSIINKLLFVF